MTQESRSPTPLMEQLMMRFAAHDAEQLANQAVSPVSRESRERLRALLMANGVEDTSALDSLPVRPSLQQRPGSVEGWKRLRLYLANLVEQSKQALPMPPGPVLYARSERAESSSNSVQWSIDKLEIDGDLARVRLRALPIAKVRPEVRAWVLSAEAVSGMGSAEEPGQWSGSGAAVLFEGQLPVDRWLSVQLPEGWRWTTLPPVGYPLPLDDDGVVWVLLTGTTDPI